MKKKVLRFLLIFLMIPCLFIFAACGNKGNNENGDGDGAGGSNATLDYSANNPEYVEFRNVMNTVASAFGTDIGLGKDANNKSTEDSASATAFVASSGIGLDIGDVHETYFAYLNELNNKTPDDTYDNPMYGFEQAMANCFKMPVIMADAVTQYYGATSVYGKTLELGYDDPTGEIVYYQINKTGNTLSTTVYTPVSKNYISDTEYTEGGYYYYYTEVEFVSANNFKFYMILTSEDNKINQIAVGDSNKNLLAFEYYPNSKVAGGIEYNLNYSNGVSGRSMSLVSDQGILDALKADFIATKAQVNMEYVDSIKTPVVYQIKTTDVDKVLDRIAEEMGLGSSSNDKYPGWYVEEGVVLGYYGDGSGARIEKLEIPSEFSAISGSFYIYSAKVDELVIPSTITKVKLRKGDYYARQGQQYNANDWYTYMEVGAEDFLLSVTNGRKGSVVGKITLEGGSSLFDYDEKHCLYKKNTRTLLYVCDAPVEEYDFRGVTLSYLLQRGLPYETRRNAKNIKKLSIDVICYLDQGMSPDEVWSYWYRYTLLDMFMIGSENNMKLDELNLYGLNMTPYALESDKAGYSINISPYEDFFPNVNYDVIENKFSSYIRKLNIYGNSKAYRIANYFHPIKLTAAEKTVVEAALVRFKIKNPYDYYDLINDLPEYCMNIGLLPYTEVNVGGSTMYQFDVQVADALFREIQTFSNLYEKYLYEQYVEKNGVNARVKLVDEINFFNNDGTPSTAYVVDLGAEEIRLKKYDYNGENLRKSEYPFLKEVYVEQEMGVYVNISLGEYYGETLDVYVPAGVLDVRISVGHEDFGGDQGADSTAARIHLPWTKETYEAYYQSRFMIGGNYTLVYAEEDEVSTYSTWLYSTHWNDTLQTEEKVLDGYFSANPNMHEITLPNDVNIVYYEMIFYGNISNIVIPANYKYVKDYNFQIHESAQSLGDHYWGIKVVNPLTKEAYYTSTVEVAANCPLFAVDEDGNLCDKTKSVIIKNYLSITNVLDLTDAKVLSKLDTIIAKADLSKVTEVIVDSRSTIIESEYGFLTYERAKFWCDNISLKLKLPNVTTLTFKYMGELLPEYTDAYLDALVEKYKDELMSGIKTRQDIINGLNYFSFESKYLSSGQDKKYMVKFEGTLNNVAVDTLNHYNGLGTIEKIYANGTLVTPENAESLGFDVLNTKFAVNTPLTEIIVSSNNINQSMYYTCGTITTVKFAEGVTSADFSIFHKINYNGENGNADQSIITDVYFASTVVSNSSYYAFVDTYDKVVNIHFNMTKQEFIDSLEGIEDDFSNHDLLKWFDWYSAFDRDLYNPNYDSPDPFIDQLVASNYDKFVNADETCGMRFYFTDTEV